MEKRTPVIQVTDLHRAYGKLDAVNGLNLSVQPGRCYGFFGRNGAGKTTTISCLLNLLRPQSGSVRLFGMCPEKDEVAVKSRLSWVPDTIAFYPWMRIHSYFSYLASLRQKWNRQLEGELVARFDLDPSRKVNSLSKGEKMQVALIGAICPEPELLLLDEPTSGLDPVVRKEFIKTVIGAYQDGDPENRTVFVSTHLITEFEGLIDEFTVIEKGRDILTTTTEEAKNRYQRIVARFTDEKVNLDAISCLEVNREGREIEVICNGNSSDVFEQLKALKPESLERETLRLEDIFRAQVKAERQNDEPKTV